MKKEENKEENKEETKEEYYIITDIEGNRRFFDDCLEMGDEDIPLLVLGDMWDRGTVADETAIWHTLGELPVPVITVVGNRDANKMRWFCELENWIARPERINGRFLV